MAINLLGLKVQQLNYYQHSCMYLIYIIRIVFTTIWKVIGLYNDKKDYLKTLLSPSQFLLNISIVHQDKVTLCFHMKWLIKYSQWSYQLINYIGCTVTSKKIGSSKQYVCLVQAALHIQLRTQYQRSPNSSYLPI